MKNIYIITTDKPSRLYEFGGELILTNEPAAAFRNQHIYITSDEEIKEGDCVYSTSQDYNIQKVSKGLEKSYNDVEHYKKIILTTDPTLIADGVQAIDDEFLEWFVKNPSCEEVEVGYGWIRLTETDNKGYWISISDKQFEMQQDEPKQETLEEVAHEMLVVIIKEKEFGLKHTK